MACKWSCSSPRYYTFGLIPMIIHTGLLSSLGVRLHLTESSTPSNKAPSFGQYTLWWVLVSNANKLPLQFPLLPPPPPPPKKKKKNNNNNNKNLKIKKGEVWHTISACPVAFICNVRSKNYVHGHWMDMGVILSLWTTLCKINMISADNTSRRKK